MDQQNAEITIGDYTQIAVEQLGPMITGTSGTTIDIRKYAVLVAALAGSVKLIEQLSPISIFSTATEPVSPKHNWF
jgi:hypothetical protein